MSDDTNSKDLLQRMCLIRAFEERVIDLYHGGTLSGLVHVGIGQEAVAVGVSSALEERDYVYGSHRSHGHFLARGADPGRLMAELAGRATGYCQGLGGSMHLVDVKHRLMSATGIVGGTMPLALGTALAARDEGAVVVVYFGDGAANTGGFHESLNIAALWSLPVVLVCENNGYAEFTPASEHTVVERVSVHASTYGIPAEDVDGNDVLKVRRAAVDAISHARDGGGPAMIECLTYRLRGHYVGDPAQYRQASEVEEWRQKDPIRLLTGALRNGGATDAAELDTIVADAVSEVDRAVEFALSSPFPDPSLLDSMVLS
jgi:TPP-dependent pyruvate/acetoin dehydrogenase alpha subunit